MTLTTDPNDPRLEEQRKQSTGQHNVYLVLSDAERAKGFVRPYRYAYRHVGVQPQYPLRDLNEDEKVRYKGCNYAKYEVYGADEAPMLGRYWTQAELDAKACGSMTTMGRELSETYARDPHFYGATFCVRCNRHLPVGEFVWEKDGERLGS